MSGDFSLDFGPDFGQSRTTSPWGEEFTWGFGQIGHKVTRDPGLMATLGSNNMFGQTLYWDYSESQTFHVWRTDGQYTGLYEVSPKFSSQWFYTGSTVYDPFYYSVPGTQNPSTLE